MQHQEAFPFRLAADEPQVLAVPHEELEHVVRAVHIVGLRLQEVD